MENVQAIIGDFLDRLQQQTSIIFKIEFGDQVVTGIADQLRILIYLPNSQRKLFTDGCQTIHIDIDQIIHDGAKIIFRIRGLLGLGLRIYARQTVVARIDKAQTMEFQQENHLQIALPGKYRYGLFYHGELVSVAVFSGGRRMRNVSAEYRSFELLRFCHKRDYHVIGAISKLLKSLCADFSPDDVMTYADLDWTVVSSLEKIGFVAVGKTDPQEFWIEKGFKRRYNVPENQGEYYSVKNNGSIKLKHFFSKLDLITK